ncbi:MAG: hypothetical protein JNJ57_05630 [Saprospiraceae bacterium]|nr:hypothetical protein [Saprospiraceae bacterium]
MATNEKVDVIIYRVRENGLEVFMVDPSSGVEGALTTPASEESEIGKFPAHSIELDPVTTHEGEARRAIAIEADWHEIPSLRALIYEDYRVAKEKAKMHIKTFVADFEKGAYVAIKEAAKRVMPEQYAFLKELKDIIADKNQGNSI